MKIRSLFSYSCMTVALVLFFSPRCYSQSGTDLYQYASKFLCGIGDGSRTVKGHYLTAINIHNPSDSRAIFNWKVAVASPPPSGQLVSPFAPLELIPDGAAELICKQILQQSRLMASFVTGFLVIESKTPLDVVAVYTATDPSGRSISIDVKPTEARTIPPHKLPDLIVGGSCQSAQVIGLTATATIQNIGAAPAGPSITRFIFTPTNGATAVGPSTSTDVPTPGLSAGASVSLSTSVPGACFQPNCRVDVQADATNVVKESNETNNFDTTTCIG
jgi:hypothetical protein